MSGESPRRAIRRVTALVESGQPATDLLITAADLAARLHAEVQGLLLEDANLRRFGQLDIARVASRFAAAGPVGPRELLASVEALAEQARMALQGAAQSLGLAWSFQVVSREPDLEPRIAVQPRELLIVELGRAPAAAPARQAVALWAATAPDAASMLVLRGRLPVGRPVVLVAGESELAARALAIAADLLPADAPHLDVLLADAGADAARLAGWARRQTRSLGRRAHLTVLADGAVDSVLRAARHAAAGLLLLPADASCLADAGRVEALLDQGQCALLLLR